MPGDGLHRPCRTVWRKEHVIGVTLAACHCKKTRWLLNPRLLARALAQSQIFRRFLATVGDDLIADLGALGQGGEARFFDRGNMDEYVFAAGIRLNKSVPLSRVEPFHSTCTIAALEAKLGVRLFHRTSEGPTSDILGR
jgi:hypothetical protein